MFKGFLKKFRHWTVRYIYHRALLVWREWSHPNDPWFPKAAVTIIGKLLRPSDVGLEFGSGRSTLWLAEKMSKLISVESDEGWFRKISEVMNKRGVKNVEYHLESEATYTDILTKIGDYSLDFVLVDGAARDMCAKRSIPKLKAGGILVIDNINWFVPSDSHSPASKRNGEFGSEIWRSIFESDIKDWRKIFVSNGVTDTVICIKSS